MADPRDPFDEGARSIESTEAQSRFTKTPIHIRNVSAIAKAIRNLGVPAQVLGRQQTEAEGSYEPNSGAGRISVDLPANTGWRDLQRAVHHEDIHALLNRAGQDGPRDSDMGLAEQSPISRFFGISPEQDARQSFWQSRRAGNVSAELPAYVGAYSPDEMKGYSQDQADRWVRGYKKTLPADTAGKYQRLIESYRASQAVGAKGK